MSDIRILPLVPLKNTVIFPILAYPVKLVQERTVLAVDAALGGGGELAVFALKDAAIDRPLQEELFDIGSMVRIVKNVRLPQGERSVILEGESRVRLLELFEQDGLLLGKVEVITAQNQEGVLFEK